MHLHNEDICSKPYHSKNHAKHPRHFVVFLRSKFGSDCSYLHLTFSPRNNELLRDVPNDEENLSKVITFLNIKEIEICKLKEKVRELEKNIQAEGCSSTQSLK